jgi:protein-S-isoprenylcysteine O-methyltransferase Ste14
MDFTNIVTALWLLSEVILNLSRRSAPAEDKNTDERTLGRIWLVIAGAVAGGVLLAHFTHAAVFIETKNAHTAGSAIIVFGMLMRFAAIAMLGRFFTVDVTIRKEHEIVQKGLYRFVRHPSYTGALISFAGFGIVQNNWFSLPVVFIPVCLAMLMRIRVEERALLVHFGSAYEAYMKKTWRLIPFVY